MICNIIEEELHFANTEVTNGILWIQYKTQIPRDIGDCATLTLDWPSPTLVEAVTQNSYLSNSLSLRHSYECSLSPKTISFCTS